MRTTHRARISGFSLVEMLAVVGVVAIILGAVTPMLFSTLTATKITTAGDAILGQVSLARQLSVSRNREIEMRIYSYVDPDTPGDEPVAKAIVLCELSGDNARPDTPVAETYYLPSGVAIGRTGALSPIFRSGNGAQPDTERFIRKATNATYVSVNFLPDGTTNISLPANQSYLTVAEERLVGTSAGGNVPPNFYAIQIDPLTGRARSYRPGA